MKKFLMQLVPYGIVCRWLAVRRGINIDRPLFFYPGVGKCLKRIVKYALPYGLVMVCRKHAFPQDALGTDAPAAKSDVCEVLVHKMDPLPARDELGQYAVARHAFCDGGAQRPDVTVVTVIFNIVKSGRAESFRQCLDSVQSQTGVTIEHLIVDGASKDGTLALLDGYEDRRHPVRVFSALDRGIYHAMNRGLVLANGRYVTFLNSDDFYSDPLGLRDSVARLDESKAEFSYAPVIVLGEDGRPIDHPNSHPDVRRFYFAMAFCHQSVLTRTDAFRQIGGFNDYFRSAADYDSVLRMIFRGYHAVKVDRPYVTFRTGGFSWTNKEFSQRECGAMFADLYGRYLQQRLTPEEGYRVYITQHGPIELEEKAMRYIDETFGLSNEREIPRSSVTFSDRGNVYGLYEAEKWGAWTGRYLRVYNRIGKEMLGRDLVLSFYIGSCPTVGNAISVRVRCNGRLLAEFAVLNFMPAKHDVRCPADFQQGDEMVLDLLSSEVVVSRTDPRELGLSFERVEFSVAEEGSGL